jgi:hypothetical protein
LRNNGEYMIDRAAGMKGGVACYYRVGDSDYTMTRDGSSWWLDFKHCGKSGKFTPYYSVVSSAPFPPASGESVTDLSHSAAVLTYVRIEVGPTVAGWVSVLGTTKNPAPTVEGGSGGGGGSSDGSAKKEQKGPAALPTSVCGGLAFVSEVARRTATADPETCIGALDA